MPSTIVFGLNGLWGLGSSKTNGLSDRKLSSDETELGHDGSKLGWVLPPPPPHPTRRPYLHSDPVELGPILAWPSYEEAGDVHNFFEEKKNN